MAPIFYSILSFLSGLFIAQTLVETYFLPLLVVAVIAGVCAAILNYFLTSPQK